MTLDLSRPITTRAGYRVQVLAVLDQPTDDGETIVALVCDDFEKTREIFTYRADGAFFPESGESGLDLINTPLSRQPVPTPEWSGETARRRVGGTFGS